MIEAQPLLDAVMTGPARIDDIDATLGGLIMSAWPSAGTSSERARPLGGPRVVTAPERDVVQRCHGALGRPGPAIGPSLLDLSREPL
jgi:hypothetical protein